MTDRSRGVNLYINPGSIMLGSGASIVATGLTSWVRTDIRVRNIEADLAQQGLTNPGSVPIETARVVLDDYQAIHDDAVVAGDSRLADATSTLLAHKQYSDAFARSNQSGIMPVDQALVGTALISAAVLGVTFGRVLSKIR